jgi:lipid A 4'-phosphatase
LRPNDPRPILGVLAGLLTLLAVYLIWPRLDLAVSAAFFDAASQTFPVNGQRLPEAIRMAVWDMSAVVLIGAALALLASLVLRRPVAGLPARAWGFVVALYALGPGLVVEEGLKNHWGRARPDAVAEFGGAAQFTPPWLPAGQCLKNCAFVSGEAAGGMALALSLLLILLWWRGRMPPALWRSLVGLALCLPLVVSAQRLMAGRHFLSDILFAFLLVALVAALLVRYLRPLPPAPPAPVDNRGDSSY